MYNLSHLCIYENIEEIDSLCICDMLLKSSEILYYPSASLLKILGKQENGVLVIDFYDIENNMNDCNYQIIETSLFFQDDASRNSNNSKRKNIDANFYEGLGSL